MPKQRKQLVSKCFCQSLYGWRIMLMPTPRACRQVGVQLREAAGKSIDRSFHGVATHAGSRERMCGCPHVTLDAPFGKRLRACDQVAQDNAYRLALIRCGHLEPPLISVVDPWQQVPVCGRAHEQRRA